MTIGFDAKRAFQNNTGLGNYSRMFIAGIASMYPADRLLLFTPKREGRYKYFFDSYKNVEVIEPKGIWLLLPSLWRTFGLRGRIGADKRNMDIFHGLSHELPLFLPKKVKKVVTMHDMIVWRNPDYFPFFDRIIYKVKQRSAARRADTVVAISRQTAVDVEHWLGTPREKTKIVYQSCDSQFYAPVGEEQCSNVRSRYNLPSRYIICVGTIERRKNQVSVVKAMPLLPADVHLVVLGRQTDYFEAVQDAVRNLYLESRVHFIHKAVFADFPALYKMAEVSVYMSLFEGWGIPVLESMCCGTPVVTSNCSSMPEVGGDAALYADPCNVDDIGEKLNRVIANQSLRDQMRQKGLAQAERYSWNAVVESMYELYKKTLTIIG